MGPSKVAIPGSTTPLPEEKRLETPQESEEISGTVFPLELDGSENRTRTVDGKIRPIGPSFATSYKERMNALRSTSSSPSPGSLAALDDGERKAKADALKSLLLNPTQHRVTSGSPGHLNVSSTFSSRSNSATPSKGSTIRPPSLPTPASSERSAFNINPAKDNRSNSIPYQYLTSLCNGASFPSPSPSTRKDISPATRSNQYPQTTHINSARACSAQSAFHGNYVSPTPNRTASPLSTGIKPAPGVSSKLDSSETKRMEDELRRILKLTPSANTHGVNGVEQTIA
ncbi:predicted protein [Uncinocarpus reesii 1704]|uniref:Uncharacterized protein n=1 Tax=Uncinocarpus reesii (strain UAMH 1704) TaxID=336963 RepID=C4JMT6_UNCRE|nr:uncharacterized protein UREG_04144 [Uncinocarpus reesii 1704]EEP79298.1 predicted protein [Uncinocarpus reesii 1704]